MNTDAVINLVYIFCAFCFSYGLKMMSKPARARRGNLLSSVGMLIAVIATLFSRGIISYEWIIVGVLAGSVAGALIAYLVAMTQMPQMVALLNGFGGGASLLVAWETQLRLGTPDAFNAVVIFLAALIGGLTFTGSLIAWGKLGGFVTTKPVLFGGQKIVNALLLAATLAAGAGMYFAPEQATPLFYVVMAGAFALGVLAVIPIGGADMPVVISLLNSYSGLAGCAAGFVVNNSLLIVTGALVGASGIILTQLMCKAMNRSLANVLFSGFGAAGGGASGGTAVTGEAKPINVEDAYAVLEAAGSVVIVPGYGLAVAQAQHVVRELGELLEANGAEVRYAIHPVAGRMPGHMNVLLAEANVSYDQLFEMDAVNPIMETVDVCMVIGANDVVNPAAREDEASPIYGMPIINVDKARTVFVLKRSMASGFAGVDNPLFFLPNTRMLFGDAKASVQALVAEFKSGV